jgi:hypothetical protein
MYNLEICDLYRNAKDYGIAEDFLEEVIVNFNGDLTLWSMYHIKGLLKAWTVNLYEAKDAFEKALYYYPKFELSHKRLDEINKIIEEKEIVCKKLRGPK